MKTHIEYFDKDASRLVTKTIQIISIEPPEPCKRSSARWMVRYITSSLFGDGTQLKDMEFWTKKAAVEWYNFVLQS